MNALELFSKIYDLPSSIRNRLLSLGFARVIPLAAGLGVSVEELDENRVVTAMPFSRRSRNHVGSIYIGALIVHAELTMATLVISRCRPPQFRVLVKKNEHEFHARASGTVRATCAPSGDEHDAIPTFLGLQPGAKAERWLTVTTKIDETAVCTSRFLVSVKRAS